MTRPEGFCYICNYYGKLINHHIQYKPVELTLPVCRMCHAIIHSKQGKKMYPGLIPPSQAVTNNNPLIKLVLKYIAEKKHGIGTIAG